MQKVADRHDNPTVASHDSAFADACRGCAMGFYSERDECFALDTTCGGE